MTVKRFIGERSDPIDPTVASLCVGREVTVSSAAGSSVSPGRRGRGIAVSPEDRRKAGDVFGRLENAVDETLKASFPASDPPSWTLGRGHGDRYGPEDPST